MPYITIKLVEGRSLDQKARLVKKVTRATCEALDVEPATVRIELIELAGDNFAVAGRLVKKIMSNEKKND